MTLALGLMSGTSADGVSLALIELQGRSLRVRAHDTLPYSGGLRRRILAAPGMKAAGLCELNFELGRVFSAAAVRFLRRRGVKASSLAAVGSHGQTILHLPRARVPSTLQLGEPSFLAEALGVPVVSDFRPRDMAAGGEGAPLVPFFDDYVFGGGAPVVLQNIGGIGNASLVGRGLEAFGFDTGPGNCLMDLAVRRMSGGRLAFDRDGRIARRGRVREDLARSLLRQPFFRRPPPKSLERTEFGEAYLAKHFRKLADADAVATLTFFTALTIADAYRRFLFPRAEVREAVVSGGGALNPVLMGHLRRLLAPLPVRTSAEHGLPVMAKESAMIALLAALAVQGRTNHCFRATGARGPRVLGKITPGR
ncbi:MAG TPA: anhydro-N-acetylmuramic acid kinase [Elusimicrobia bacterium]|nr:anhydro-N-acetylmuramic acid kinase [Elusimicrobiota bacterium]